MKKIYLLVFLCVIFLGCSKDDAPIQNATFTVGLSLPHSGSMVRGAADLYTGFYNNYIASQLLVPKEYSLTITKDGENIGSARGEWNADFITLPEGKYKFWGTTKGDFEKLTLEFNEEVTITKNTTSINLTAIYDCYMLFFDQNIFSNVEVHCNGSSSSASTSVSLPKTDEIHYLFLPHRSASSIAYETISGDRGSVYLKNYTFEKGKYYMFDIVNGQIAIPQMTSGI